MTFTHADVKATFFHYIFPMYKYTFQMYIEFEVMELQTKLTVLTGVHSRGGCGNAVILPVSQRRCQLTVTQ